MRRRKARLRVESVAHELELAIGGDEADRAVVLEAGQPHALMEFDVLHLHRLPLRPSPSRSPAGRLKEQLEAERTVAGQAPQLAGQESQLAGQADLPAQVAAGQEEEQVEEQGEEQVEQVGKENIKHLSYTFAYYLSYTLQICHTFLHICHTFFNILFAYLTKVTAAASL